MDSVIHSASPQTLRKKYGFVVPRFGKNIGGGAETLVGALASHLAESGHIVEIFTTCALDNRTWENFYPEGEFQEGKLRVHRFPVDARDLDLWIPLQIRLSEGMALNLDEQFQWMQHSVNSHKLYQYIADNASRFDALFFAPYLFGTTFHGALIHPQNSYLIPCLHDESYAYVQVIQSMFRQVAGALFNAEPEMDLARRLYGEVQGGVVGMGFTPFESHYVEGLSPYFEDEFPYLLYVGRKETGKNVQCLVDFFISAKESGKIAEELALVVVGGGSFDDVQRPAARTRKDIIDLPQVSEEEKHRLMRHALFLCQPSRNESFSIVLMEAWLLGVPTVVHADCAVTRHHVQVSGAGLYFRDALEFEEIVHEFLRATKLRETFGRAGLAYVQKHYNWEAVLGRFDNVMREFQPA